MSNILRIGTITLASICLADASTGPELGCYYYELPSKVNKVQAQLEIKSGNIMEVSVAFDAPKLNLPANTIVCPNEPFRFDSTSTQMIIGEGELSECLQNLKAYTRNAVKTPLTINWISEEKILAATIVIPLRIPMAANCIQFATPTSTITPNEVTSTVSAVVSLSASTNQPSGSPRLDDSTTGTATTPKGYSNVATLFVLLSASALLLATGF